MNLINRKLGFILILTPLLSHTHSIFGKSCWVDQWTIPKPRDGSPHCCCLPGRWEASLTVPSASAPPPAQTSHSSQRKILKIIRQIPSLTALLKPSSDFPLYLESNPNTIPYKATSLWLHLSPLSWLQPHWASFKSLTTSWAQGLCTALQTGSFNIPLSEGPPDLSVLVAPPSFPTTASFSFSFYGVHVW